MSALPWIAAGGYELGRWAITSPWFWNIVLYGEQELELHRMRRQLELEHQAEGGAAPPSDPCAQPAIGSGDWVDLMETLETEAAAWPPPCDCEDCCGHHY